MESCEFCKGKGWLIWHNNDTDTDEVEKCNTCDKYTNDTQANLEYLRGELRAGTMSYGETAELMGLVEYIEPGDVELLEAAGVPEFPDE